MGLLSESLYCFRGYFVATRGSPISWSEFDYTIEPSECRVAFALLRQMRTQSDKNAGCLTGPSYQKTKTKSIMWYQCFARPLFKGKRPLPFGVRTVHFCESRYYRIGKKARNVNVPFSLLLLQSDHFDKNCLIKIKQLHARSILMSMKRLPNTWEKSKATILDAVKRGWLISTSPK